MKTYRSLLALALLATPLITRAGEISYNERFALGGDRKAALAELIPGTQEYYYYNALQLEHEGRLAEAKKMIDDGVKKHGHTGLLRELENRYALKNYKNNPGASLSYIIDRLNLHFNHQQKKLKPEVRLPTTLNQDSISFNKLAKYAFAESRNTERFEDSAFDYLVTAKLTPDQRRSLLSRLRRPDYPGIVKLIIDDLNYRHSRGFWHHQVHKMLTIEQLEQCLEKKPDLINQSNFINTYLTKLKPNEDVDWAADDKEHAAYLARLQAFADRLPVVYNSLKANIMFLQLQFNLKKGVYDKPLFARYIKMPRPVHYINPHWLKRKEFQNTRVNMNASYQAYISLPPIRADEAVVRPHLMHFLKDAPGFKEYENYVEYNYLKRLFAEVKLVNGIGDAEKWYAIMDSPSLVKQLRDRIDLELLPINAEYVEPDDPVTVNVAVKNVKDLTIRVYEINTTGYYRQNLTEITTAIELDGLVPNSSSTKKYKLPPMRRHVEKLDFPGIKEPGVYVIELIGNGVSSRALVRKGRLAFTERIGSAGHVFMVYDDAGKLLQNAVLWMGGTEYKAEDGEIHIPFSGKPKKQSMVLTHKGFSVLRDFQHLGENYELRAGMHLGREQLVSGKECTVTVRPELLLNGEQVDVSLLEHPILTIRSTDIDGHSAEKQVNDFRLHDEKDSTYTFRVPKRLRSMVIVLSGKVQNLNTGKKMDMSAHTTIAANQVKETDKIEDVFLRYASRGYIAELLGRNAEARDGRAVHVELKHRDFRRTVHVSLKTDAKGRAYLGALKDIVWVKIRGPEETGHTWQIPQDKVSRVPLLHMLAGDTLRIPVMHTDERPLHKVVSFLETRGGTFVKDRIDRIRKAGGYLVIRDLPPGDYSLMTKPDARITLIRVTTGKAQGSQLIGKNRVLEQKAAFPLQIKNIEVKGEDLVVKIANAVPGTRVHMAMTRYVSDDLFRQFGVPSFRSPAAAKLSRPKSQYLSGRRIGDEYRYVMERRKGGIFPGNMLTRPSLILNPWSPRTTDTGTDYAREGEAYRRLQAPGARGVYASRAPGARGSAITALDQFTCFDFLADISPIAMNLKPDKNGVVKIPVKKLPVGQQLHVYAVNASSAVYRQRALKEHPEQPQDLRLKRYLSPDSHFTEQKRTSIVRKGGTFTAANILSARVEVVDSVAAAYRLLTALNDDATLAEFNFIVNWPDHSREKKQELYRKYACHELHLFLAMKDPGFFKKVVRPYLANKKDKKFVDDRLLGNPLDTYLEPWAYGRLNMVERALLAQQAKAQHKSTARHLKDLYDLLPPDIEKFNRLFDSALRSSGLEGPSAGLAMVMTEAVAQEGADLEMLEDSDELGFVALGARVAGRPRAEPAPAMAKGRLLKAKKEQAAREPEEEKLMELAERVMGPDDITPAKADTVARRKRAERDAKRRATVRQLYRKLEKTREWVENNYYRQLIQQQVAELVKIDAFWKDYAAWDGKGRFLSGNLSEAGDSFTEIMMALAVLDLPFKAGKHDYQYKDGSLVFKAGSDVIIFHKQVQAAEGDVMKSVLLINQSFFARDDRYRYENNERFDKFVTKEFEKGRVYGCLLVLTNPTSTRRKVDVLQQIPAGAIPVLRGMQTRSRHAVLEPYSTQSQEYYFYFPAEGNFPHYPVHVAQNEQVVAAADPFTFKVVAEVDEIDRGSWEHISQYGTEKEVVEYMNTHNIDRVDLNMIAWRMRNKAFFNRTLALLQGRKVYNQTLWSYSLHHNVQDRIREYLPHTAFANGSGRIIESPLLDLDPIIRHIYEHKEYWPLVNARVFKLGNKRKILNRQFYEQYEHFMKVLTYRPALTDNDEMAVTIYMLLQDRVDESLRYYDAVDPSKLKMRIQHDYMSAYMAFYREKPGAAKKIAAKYKDYPVDRWRNLFRDVLAQCDEIGGKSAGVVDDEDRTQTQTKLADTAPRLQLETEGSVLKIDHANLEGCTVNYYPMDIELLFSRQPFVQDVGNQFTVIKPNRSDFVKLEGEKVTEIKVPKELKDRNLMIEVAGAGISRLEAYYPNALKVDVIENYGQLRVADKKTGKALPKVYIKVYARMGRGQARFYKDGYTDLRGRFDYTSLNTSEIDSVSRFAILVLSDTNGAMVREAAPPKR